MIQSIYHSYHIHIIAFYASVSFDNNLVISGILQYLDIISHTRNSYATILVTAFMTFLGLMKRTIIQVTDIKDCEVLFYKERVKEASGFFC